MGLGSTLKAVLEAGEQKPLETNPREVRADCRRHRGATGEALGERGVVPV